MLSTILGVVIIASVAIGYFMSISLVTSTFYKSRANKYLSLSLFLITTLTFLEWVGIYNNVVIYSPLVHAIVLQFFDNIRLDLLFAASLYIYFLIQIKHELLDGRRYKWVYLPFFASVVLEISISLSDYVLDLHHSGLDLFIFLAKDFGSIGFNIFLIFSARHFIRKSNTISEDKKRWLLRLNLLVICLIISWVLTRLELWAFNSQYTANILWVLLSFLSWWILYYGIFRLQVLVQKEEIHEYLVSKPMPVPEVKKKINSVTITNVITQLYKLMEEEELYKNPLLSRSDLAVRLETNEGYLSQIINQEINSSVIQFVNEYRVEAAKKLLHNPVFNKYSVEAIGLEAGFKSKSAFYNVFKTSLGMSPGAYRKLQKTS